MAKKKADAADAPVKARVLSGCNIDGKACEADSVVTATAAQIADLEALGLVDSDTDAVAYAESLVEPKVAE